MEWPTHTPGEIGSNNGAVAFLEVSSSMRCRTFGLPQLY
jgi:hypothetical protein